MLLEDVWSLFSEKVFPVPSTDRLFNLYRDYDERFDRPDAAEIRRQNLRSYLACYDRKPPVLLLLEAPGPWGCRFSGVPITSEAHLVDDGFPISGRPSSTRVEPHTEYSAGIYWRVMTRYFPHFFTWSSVPFHPHHKDEPLSIRNPSNGEVAAYHDVVAGLVGILEPRHVLAVGRKAEHALKRIGIASTYVRHPSQGGARRFEEGVTRLFEEIALPG